MSMWKTFSVMATSLLVAVTIILGGCGGDSSSSSETSPAPTVQNAKGVFLDSAVEGLRYVSGGLEGFTGRDGGFEYEDGRSVHFYIGDVLIGRASGADTLTPVDLVDGAQDHTHPTVANISRFLQSLDDDGDPSNGITLLPAQHGIAAGKAIDFVQSIDEFSNDGSVQVLVAELTNVTTAGAREMVSVTDALEHMAGTLVGILVENPDNPKDADNGASAGPELLGVAQAASSLVCDADGDGVIDRNDINLIFSALNQPATDASDPRDIDRDGTITIFDARQCVLQCTLANCVIPASVPDVIGMPQASAEAAITAANLNVGTVTAANSETVPVGDVISQNPVGGDRVAPASAVDLVVSTGPAPVPVPDVVGMAQADAEAAIAAAGLAVGTIGTAASATVPAGHVISQNPVAGSNVSPGSSVNLTISSGAALVTVPSVVGFTQLDAEAAITTAGLVVGVVNAVPSDTVPAGNVISQNPAGGSNVAPGTAVDLVVSSGPAPVTVPNVVGQSQADAEAALVAADLSVGNVTTAASDTVPEGNVISQNPAGGSSVAPGTAVDLVVSSGTAPVTVPNVVGQSQADAESALVAADLTVGNVTTAASDTVPVGDVISQNPSAGSSAAPGTAVDLVVSSGPAPVTVPNVVGQSQAAAEAALVAADLTVGNVTTAASDTVPAGDVISQNPSAGSSVAPGTAVDLVVSSGPVLLLVPDVVGLEQAIAEEAIADAGFVVGTVSSSHSETVAAGIVISQDPTGFTSAALGTAVDLVISLGPTSPLGLAVTLNPDPVRPGEAVHAIIELTNRSDSAVNDIVLQAEYPSVGVNNLNSSAISDGGTCPGTCFGGELVTWSIGTVPAGQGITLSLPLRISTTAVTGTVISLPVEALASGVTVTTASASAIVETENALSLALHEDKDAVAPGELLTYGLTYGNRSTASINSASLVLPLPEGVTFVSATGGGMLVGDRVEWSLGTLPATATGKREVTVAVDGSLVAGALLTVTTAELTGTNAVTFGIEQARATAATRVEAAPALGLVLEMDPDPVRANEGIVARLTVTNRSGGVLNGAVLQGRFPTDRVNNLNSSAISGGGTCPGTCFGGELITWNLGTLAPGAGVAVDIPLRVTSGAPSGTLIRFDAVVNAEAVSPARAGHSVVVDNTNALSLALHEDKDAVAPGELLTYGLTYGNRSTASINSASLVLPLPEGVTFVSATGGGMLVGDRVEWSLGTLPATATGKREVTVAVDGSLVAGALLTVTTAELTGTNAVTFGIEQARATAATRVAIGSPLALKVTLAPDSVQHDETTTGSLTITNTGGSTLFGVVLHGRFPTDRVDNLNSSAISGGGTCPGTCFGGELITWNLGTLAPGAETTVSIPLTVSNSAPLGTLITFRASVRDDTGAEASDGESARVEN